MVLPVLAFTGAAPPMRQYCDPRAPLQRSKLENRENDIFGVRRCLFWGPSWNRFNGLFGAFTSLPSQGFSIEGGNKVPLKAH